MGGDHAINSSSSANVVDASSMYRGRYQSTAVSTIFPAVLKVGTMNPVLDSTDLKILSATAFVWRRLRISSSDTVGARPDQTTSLRSCSTALKIVDLRPLLELE